MTYDRGHLRYPSDLTDPEWALVGPLIPPAKRGGNKRTVDIREVVNGLMYVLSTGCQWRAIPKDLPPSTTIHDYFRRWTDDRTFDSLAATPFGCLDWGQFSVEINTFAFKLSSRTKLANRRVRS